VATSSRYVLHSNQVRQWSIPLGVGFQRQRNRWLYGSSLAVVGHLVQSQSGRLLNSFEEIVDFNEESDDAPFNNFYLGIRLAPFISYQLSDHLVVTFLPHWNWNFNASPGNSSFELETQQLNLNVGVGYHF